MTIVSLALKKFVQMTAIQSLCIICHRAFEAKGRRQITCSRACGDRRERNRPRAKVSHKHSRELGKVLKGERSIHKPNRHLGCTRAELKAWIEGQWQEGMTWENYGGTGYDLGRWQIDHKRPLASFDLLDAAEVVRAFHYTNLQPLWCFQNHAKGAAIHRLC